LDVVLCYVPAEGDPFGACDLAKPENVSLVTLSRSLPWPLQGLHSNRFFAARLVSHLGARPADVLMVRHLKLARALLARCAHIPLLYEAHEVFADTAPPRRRARIAQLEAWVVRRAQALVTNSRATANRLIELYSPARSPQVIPNGVDYPSHIPAKDWTRCSERVVYAGSFFGWKGVDDLVAAAQELPGLHITLLGGDDESIGRLRDKVTSGGAKLDFPGRVSPLHVARALEHACIAVLPNRADADSAFTSPIKLFEYMAAGCAIVASDLPAVREILAADEAVWVRPGDAHSLAAGLRRLTSDPGLARALSERVRIKARRYTWSQRGIDLAQLLRTMVSAA
jgi:glycosyltransferase involved in cell wall biosynthesis